MGARHLQQERLRSQVRASGVLAWSQTFSRTIHGPGGWFGVTLVCGAEQGTGVHPSSMHEGPVGKTHKTARGTHRPVTSPRGHLWETSADLPPEGWGLDRGGRWKGHGPEVSGAEAGPRASRPTVGWGST